MSFDAAQNKKYLDAESGLARVRGNQVLFNRMLGLFMASEEFAAFEDALAANNLAQAGDVAHAIKGMAGNLALNAVFETSSELMVQLRQGPPDPGLLTSYRDTLEKTKEIIAEYMAQA